MGKTKRATNWQDEYDSIQYMDLLGHGSQSSRSFGEHLRTKYNLKNNKDMFRSALKKQGIKTK